MPPSATRKACSARSIDRYVERYAGFWEVARAAPTARAMVEHLLRASADFLTDEANPNGCLIVRGADGVQRGCEQDPR